MPLFFGLADSVQDVTRGGRYTRAKPLTTGGSLRFNGLDTLRGVAALCVVAWHWPHFFYIGTEDHHVPADLPLQWLLGSLYVWGWLAVDLFFVLSGFIFYWLYAESVSHERISAARFALLRFSRLYPLHALTLLIVALGQVWHRGLTGSFFVYPLNDAYHFLLNVGFASAWGLQNGFSFNAPVWSVSVEILLYALFFASCRTLGVKTWVPVVFCIVAFVLFDRNEYIARGIIGFFTGGSMFLLYRRLAGSRLAAGAALGGCVIGWAALFAWGVPKMDDLPILWLFANDVPAFPFWVTAIIFPLTILSLALIERLRPLPATWLGEISYSSYLLHFPLQLILVACCTQFGVGREVFSGAGAMVSFATVLVLLSLWCHRRFELPIQRALRRQSAFAG